MDCKEKRNGIGTTAQCDTNTDSSVQLFGYPLFKNMSKILLHAAKIHKNLIMGMIPLPGFV